MPKFDLITPGWNRSDLETETLRIFDICDGCRRCFNLCPSFTTLLDRIDDHESDLSKLTPQDFTQVEQECYYCKLCFNHCPYSPPHKYDLDFPRLMAAWKKQRTAEGGATWRDKFLIQTDFIGKIGSLTAPLTNWALRTPWVRRPCGKGCWESIIHERCLRFNQKPFLNGGNADGHPLNPQHQTERSRSFPVVW